MLAKSISGAAAAVQPAFIEDVFSTYLYTGNGSTQTITNGIDLAGKGGLVWIKGRSGATGHRLTDTARGVTKSLESNSSAAGVTESTGLTAFNGTGFSIGADADYNTNTATYASWTFRKQAKFFDVVTWTGNDVAGRTISHSLGSTPGCIIVKCTSTSGINWVVYHRSLGSSQAIFLNLTNASQAFGAFNYTNPTATDFTVSGSGEVNGSLQTYVAYLFAHNAGGFGLTGTDNVISCGSYTGNGSATGPVVTLGYEPQWLLIKRTDVGGNYWQLVDVLRGMSESDSFTLSPNSADADNQVGAPFVVPTATGFRIATTGTSVNANGSTYIYIAIRRGPMKVPTSGTSVFAPQTRSGNSTATNITNVGFSPDLLMGLERNPFAGTNATIYDRLRNTSALESTANSQTEKTGTDGVIGWDIQNGIRLGTDASRNNINTTGANYGYHFFRRAPGFFDVVAYTGTGAARTVNHNLAAVPEMMIVKRRDSAADWWVYDTATGNTKYQVLNSTATPVTSSTAWNNTTPTSSVFTVGTGTPVNASAGTYVAYLFASAPGVSKVGSYTGNGTSQTINCSFTGGARFILIKRTDATGDFYVWDTARGIVTANDPHLSLNTTAAEVTTDDSIDTNSTGFIVNQVAATNINVSSATYIFLAIA